MVIAQKFKPKTSVNYHCVDINAHSYISTITNWASLCVTVFFNDNDQSLENFIFCAFKYRTESLNCCLVLCKLGYLRIIHNAINSKIKLPQSITRRVFHFSFIWMAYGNSLDMDMQCWCLFYEKIAFVTTTMGLH